MQTVRHIFYAGPPFDPCLDQQFGGIALPESQTPAGSIQVGLYRNLYLGKS